MHSDTWQPQQGSREFQGGAVGKRGAGGSIWGVKWAWRSPRAPLTLLGLLSPSPAPYPSAAQCSGSGPTGFPTLQPPGNREKRAKEAFLRDLNLREQGTRRVPPRRPLRSRIPAAGFASCLGALVPVPNGDNLRSIETGDCVTENGGDLCLSGEKTHL